VARPDSKIVSQQLASFAACIFEPSDIINLRLIQHVTDHVPNFFYTAAELETKAVGRCLDHNHRGYSIYAGVNPRKRRGGTRAEDVALARCLFTEWDGITLEEARQRWQQVGLPQPTLLLFSGAGPHAYWRLLEALTDLAQWIDLQKRLVAAVKSDNIHDLPRVMRLPGFINQKPDRGQLVELLDADSNRRYALADLAASLPSVGRDDDLGENDELPNTKDWEHEEAGKTTGLKPGQDFDARGDVHDVLRRTGWVFVRKESDGTERLRRPGKSYGISASLKDRWLYCFTTSTKLPARKALSPFAVLTYLEHDGDFSASAKALAAKGYGEKPKNNPLAVAARRIPMPDPFVPFPTGVLPCTISRFIDEGASAIGCDPALIGLPLLAALAGCIGTTRRLRIKHNWYAPAVIWTAAVVDSGQQKSPAQGLVTQLLYQRQGRDLTEHVQRMAEYQKQLARYERELGQWKRARSGPPGDPPERPAEPVCKRIIVSDSTIEAVADRLNDNPRGLFLDRDELSGWLGSYDQYRSGKGSDVSHWLSCYNTKPLLIDRKSSLRKTIHVARAAVSVTGGIQPRVLGRMLGNQHFENGLAARFGFGMPPKRTKRWTDAQLGDDVLEGLDWTYDWLLALRFGTGSDGSPMPIDMPLTLDGKEAFVEFYDRHGEEQVELSGDLAALWAKLEEVAARIALVMHLVRCAIDDATLVSCDAVDAKSIGMGVTLARWFGYEGRRIYRVLAESDVERDRRQLIEMIQRRGGRISVRDLTRNCRNYPTTDLAEAALMELVEGGAGRWEPVPSPTTGGHASREFCLGQNDTRSVNVAENASSVGVGANQRGEGEGPKEDGDEVVEWTQ